jgi:hypothetical protein
MPSSSASAGGTDRQKVTKTVGLAARSPRALAATQSRIGGESWWFNTGRVLNPKKWQLTGLWDLKDPYLSRNFRELSVHPLVRPLRPRVHAPRGAWLRYNSLE